jgi:hypothetical protein
MKTIVAVACVLAVAHLVAAGSAPRGVATAPLIERFLTSGEPQLTSFQARRVLAASTMGGRMRASLEARTYLTPDGTFRFEVVSEEGSGVIRRRVLIRALETERRNRNQREMGSADLTTANYDFEVTGRADAGLVAIRLIPRRKAPMLLDGAVTVRQADGDIVQIDGSPAERPSWWTKRVDITRHYARIEGVRVPIEMSSRADVRIAGAATFSMTYDYAMINEKPVGSQEAREPTP